MRYHICYVRNHWGRGTSVTEAKAECRRQGGKVNQRDGFILSEWEVPAGTPDDKLPRVNEYGGVEWFPPTEQVGKAVLHRDGKTTEV